MATSVPSDTTSGARPHLIVRTPAGDDLARIEVDTDRVRVGRVSDDNDVVLEPDDQRLVSRWHCVIESVRGQWIVVDNSANGTFVRRAGSLVAVAGRMVIQDGDVVCVLGRLDDAGEPAYFELSLVDPGRTFTVGTRSDKPELLYDVAQGKLVLVVNGTRRPLALRPQGHRLVRYMTQRNGENGGVSVLCGRAELMEAVWGNDPLHTPQELSRLFWELRQSLQQHTDDPFVETERGLGYRLRARLSN